MNVFFYFTVCYKIIFKYDEHKSDRDTCVEKKHVQQNDKFIHRRNFFALEYEINNDVPIL